MAWKARKKKTQHSTSLETSNIKALVGGHKTSKHLKFMLATIQIQVVFTTIEGGLICSIDSQSSRSARNEDHRKICSAATDVLRPNVATVLLQQQMICSWQEK